MLLNPSEVIDSTRWRIKCKTDSQLADRLGMVRQTFAHKRKYPSTFTGGEIAALAKLLSWSAEEIEEFVKGCGGK